MFEKFILMLINNISKWFRDKYVWFWVNDLFFYFEWVEFCCGNYIDVIIVYYYLKICKNFNYLVLNIIGVIYGFCWFC